VSVSEAVKIASALTVGMSSKQADAFLRQHGFTPGIDLISTNGRPAARLFSMSVGGHAPPGIMYYALADGCALTLHVTVHASHDQAGCLDRAVIQSNGVDIVSIKLKNAEPDGAPNRSRPADSETNRTSAAAGSGGSPDGHLDM